MDALHALPAKRFRQFFFVGEVLIVTAGWYKTYQVKEKVYYGQTGGLQKKKEKKLN